MKTLEAHKDSHKEVSPAPSKEQVKGLLCKHEYLVRLQNPH